MFDWFNRLMGARSKSKTGADVAFLGMQVVRSDSKGAPTPSGPDAGFRATQKSPGKGSSEAGPDAAPPNGNSFAQRWPLLGSNGSVRGFEFALGGASQKALNRNAKQAPEANGVTGKSIDGAAGAAHQAALMASVRLAQSEGRKALVSLPAEALGKPWVLQQVERGVWLAATDAWTDMGVQQSLRAKGARLGAVTVPLQWAAAHSGGSLSLAAPTPLQNLDFVLLRADDGGVEALLAAGERLRRMRPKLDLVATGVADVEAIEQLLRAGFALVGGRLGGRTAGRAGQATAASAAPSSVPAPASAIKSANKPATTRTLEPASVRLFALINHVAQDCDNALIAQAAREDVALSYRLLRYANSPAVGLRKSVDSIEQALSLLGRNEFRRWLQVMLLATGSSRPASLALQEDALARARLFESLGRQCGEPATDALFTLGLLSQLDLLLQVPLAEALAPLRLPEVMSAALLERRGDWAAYLALADELEFDDETRLDQAAKAFGGAARVLAKAQAAWIWAARVMASQQTPASAPAQSQTVPA